jgi:tungstate transport system permease protein
LALGLGFVLIALTLVVNFATHALSRTERESTW